MRSIPHTIWRLDQKLLRVERSLSGRGLVKRTILSGPLQGIHVVTFLDQTQVEEIIKKINSRVYVTSRFFRYVIIRDNFGIITFFIQNYD